MRSIESPFRKMNEDSNAMMNSQAQRDVKDSGLRFKCVLRPFNI